MNALGECVSKMTEKVEDINEKLDRLEKRNEELEKRDSICVLPKKDQENEKSSRDIVTTWCFGFMLMSPVVLMLFHLVFFVIVSYKILDFKIIIERYFKFLEDSICKYYQSLGLL